MYVHFIDTSVFTNIINVPGRNQQHDSVMKELKDLLGQKDKNALILPYATIIETGNHIAHCGDGNQRRKAAEKFRNCRKITLPFKALDTIVPGIACCAGFHVNPCEIFI